MDKTECPFTMFGGAPMIDPRQTGWWAGHRLTEIGLTGSGLRGAGVSLQVLLHAFARQEPAWYSTRYGDHQNDVLLVAVDRATAGSLENMPAQRLTLAAASADYPDLVEHALSAVASVRPTSVTVDAAASLRLPCASDPPTAVSSTPGCCYHKCTIVVRRPLGSKASRRRH